MKIRIFNIIFAVLFIIASACGCQPEEKPVEQNYPVEVLGVELKEAPKSVVCLNEASALAVSALGYGSYLTGGVSEYVKPYGLSIKDLGPTYMPDWKTVYSLAPDVLITSVKPADDIIGTLALKNITLIILNIPTLYSEVPEYYENIAKIFLGAKKYKAAADTFNSQNNKHIKEMNKTNSTLDKKVAVYTEKGLIATGDTLAGDILKAAGINNVAADMKDKMMTEDELVKAAPDVIFCPKNGSEELIGNKALKDVPAIKNGAVYEINAPAIAFAGEGMVATLQDMTNYLK